MKKLLCMVIATAGIMTTTFAQSPKEILAKANEALSKLSSFECKISYSSFSKGSVSAQENLALKIIQKGKVFQFVEMENSVIVINARQQINIDKTNREMIVTRASSTTEFNNEFMKYLDSLSTLTMTLKEGTYFITIVPREGLGVEKVYVKVNHETQLITGFTMVFDETYGALLQTKSPVKKLVVELNYQKINREIDEALFNEKSYFDLAQNGNLVAKKPYENYTVIMP